MAGHPTKVWFSYMDEAVFLSLCKVCLFSGTPVFQPQQLRMYLALIIDCVHKKS